MGFYNSNISSENVSILHAIKIWFKIMDSEIVWINKTDGKLLSLHICINMYIEKDL